jgi:hypothetical protein
MTDDVVGPSFERIAELAVDMVPEEYSRIWIRCRNAAGAIDLSVVYQPIDQPFCYKDGAGSREESVRLIGPMARVFRELRQKFADAGEQPWENTTLTFDQDDAFTAEFGYENVDDDPKKAIEWDKNWKVKYLGNLKFIE